MQFRLFKLRWRRSMRMRQRQVEALGVQAEALVERNVFRRFGRLQDVRRFVLAWVGLVILLIGCGVAQLQALNGYYQSVQPVPGGIYTEGILGDFTNANPIYASTEVDNSVSHLLFAGLFTYDDQNHLVGNLAEKWSVDDKGTTYTVTLKPFLTWQDGKPLTAADVAFTYHVIQNPDALSPLQSSWQGITVKAVGPRLITFTLPNPLSAFPYSLTNGIVPQHILDTVPMNEMRSVSFNTDNPVGSGPFKWKTVEVSGNTPDTREEQIALIPFDHYVGGKPRLASFVVHAFHSQDALIKSFRANQITSMVGVSQIPSDISKNKSVQVNDFTLTAANMVFFRTSQEALTDAKVRQALVQAVNVPRIISQLGYATRAVREPILEGQLGYDPAYAQAGFDPVAAAATLQGAGWNLGGDGLRSKDGQKLAFSLYALDTAENRQVTKSLKAYWRSIGADVTVVLQNSDDLQQTQHEHIYDALLYGVAIGPDPDVYAYWDSTQADVRAANRLNFSEYKSAAADASLEAGRTRSDPALRVVKYRPFLQSWQQDAPALGLYQPVFMYATNGKVYGLSEHALNLDTDRFNNVQNWEVHTALVTNR